MSKLTKKERQGQLKEIIAKNPFLTDRELAQHFQVSIQTIRLDRLELRIPEVRERTRSVASAYTRLKSVSEGEVIGELLELKLDDYASSVLETTQEMALVRSKVIRGHYLFAQANSLAVAVIDAREVLTGSADVKFHKTVHVGEKLLAKAKVTGRDEKRYYIQVEIFRDTDLVFSGEFIMFPQKMEG